MSKVFECVSANEISPRSDNDIHHFGFKRGHSTGLCTGFFKKTIDNIDTQRGSYVFTCFIDFTKAFD